MARTATGAAVLLLVAVLVVGANLDRAGKNVGQQRAGGSLVAGWQRDSLLQKSGERRWMLAKFLAHSLVRSLKTSAEMSMRRRADAAVGGGIGRETLVQGSGSKLALKELIRGKPRHGSHVKMLQLALNQTREATTNSHVNSSAAENDGEEGKAQRGQGGEEKQEGGDEVDMSVSGSPGFERARPFLPSKYHEEMSWSDVPTGMEGEDKGAIRVMDDLAELLDRVTSDAEVVQQPAVEEKGRERWFPLGRDALVSSTPQTLARAHELESDTYRGFPDKVEGDSEEDAIHGQDVYVRTESADLSSSDLVSVPHDDDSGDNLFHDDLVAQSTEQAAPREHRLHTDYDIQGLFSDVKIPSEDYLSNLGEDGQPYGIRDRALTLRDIQAERVANSFYRVDPDKSLDDYVPEH